MNILLTSVGRRTYMINYFKEALKGVGLVHATNSSETYALKNADRFVISPLIYDSKYINFLLNYCQENNIQAIISLFDIDLPILSKNKSKFNNAGISIIVSDENIIKICNDKWLTYDFLKKAKFNTPTSFISIKNAITAIEKKEMYFPLIIKPRWGMGSIGIYQADNIEELYVLYNKSLRNINESYLKYESQQAIEKSIIIQEKIDGEEYGMDIFNDFNGNLLSIVSKKKIAMRAGETDSAEIIYNEDLLQIGEKLSQTSKHIGNLDVDCFLVKNKFYILEMNCRFGGQYPFSHLAGINFPKAIIQMLQQKKVSQTLLIPQIGTKGIKDITPIKL